MMIIIIIILLLDNVTLDSDMETVTRDVQVVAGLGPQLGLHLNLNKCEIFSPDATLDLTPLLSNFTRVEVICLSLLGECWMKPWRVTVIRSVTLWIDWASCLHKTP